MHILSRQAKHVNEVWLQSYLTFTISRVVYINPLPPVLSTI